MGKPFTKGADPRRNLRGRGKGVVSIPDLLRRVGRKRLPAALRKKIALAQGTSTTHLRRDITQLEALSDAVYYHALMGESWAVQFVAERTEGKVKDTLAIEGGATLEIVEELVDAT